MYISLNQIRKWTELTLDENWIEENLTQLGLEVESITSLKAPENVLSLKVISSQRVGEEEKYQYELTDQKTTYQLESEHKLQLNQTYALTLNQSKLQILTPQILDWNSLSLPLRVQEGRSFEETWELEDKIIELSITPNRGDCLSYLGIIHEIFIALKKEFHRDQFVEDLIKKYPYQSQTTLGTQVKMNSELVNNYHLAQVSNANIAVIPIEIEVFLMKHGLNPKNFAVALTNYIMLLLGQPMHAFDADKIQEDKISIDYYSPKDTFALLDGSDLTTDKMYPFILDGENNPLALAGVIGGHDSAVSESSKNLIFESANFHISKVRLSRTSGIVTDSSLRFERGVDSSLSLKALKLLLGLYQASDSKAALSSILENSADNPQGGETVTLSYNRLISLLGIEISKENVSIIMNLLGGQFDGDTLSLPYQHHRFDISKSCDLAEEVMRVHGTVFQKKQSQAFESLSPKVSYDKNLDFFVQQGFYEVMTFGFMDKDKAQSYTGSAENFITLSNPISSQLSTMCPSLLPNLLDITAQAMAHKHKSIKIIESAWVFDKNLEQNQKPSLSGVLLPIVETLWSTPRQSHSPFYQLKSLIFKLGRSYGLELTLKKDDHIFFESDFSWQVLDGDKPIGRLGAVSIELCHQFDWPSPAWAFELDKQALVPSKKYYKSFSRYPKITRDLSFALNRDQSVDFLLQFIQNKDKGDICSLDVDIFDYFEDKSSKLKSVGLRLTFQSSKRTLTDIEMDSYVKELLEDMEKELGVNVR